MSNDQESQQDVPPSDSLLAKLARVSGSLTDVPEANLAAPFGGEIAMRIAKDGRWFYQGSEIKRPAMVQLFARLLRKDDNRYVLVTPAECLGIEVEDVPFLVAEMAVRGEGVAKTLIFRTTLGDEVTADAAHPLRFETGEGDGLIPYVLIRNGLWARLTRALALDLIGHGEEREIDGITMFGVMSAECFFAIAPAAEVYDPHSA